MTNPGPFKFKIKYYDSVVSKGSAKDLEELDVVVKDLKKKFGEK